MGYSFIALICYLSDEVPSFLVVNAMIGIHIMADGRESQLNNV